MSSRVEVLINALLDGTTMDFEPRSRVEEYLKSCINKSGTGDLPDPNSRLDALMYKLAEKISDGSISDGDLATDEEVSDIVDDIFGGNGGTTTEGEIATDEEVSTAVNEIFNN